MPLFLYAACHFIYMKSHVVSCCWEGGIIIGNVSLSLALSLRGRCVNAPHLPADRSPDWLLMTFLGHRHVKLFIYSKKKKKKIPNANSSIHSRFYPLPPPTARRLSRFLLLSLERRWRVVVISKVCDIGTGQLFFSFCLCVCQCAFCARVTDMGHPWLWHTPTGYPRSKRIFSRLQTAI